MSEEEIKSFMKKCLFDPENKQKCLDRMKRDKNDLYIFAVKKNPSKVIREILSREESDLCRLYKNNLHQRKDLFAFYWKHNRIPCRFMLFEPNEKKWDYKFVSLIHKCEDDKKGACRALLKVFMQESPVLYEDLREKIYDPPSKEKGEFMKSCLAERDDKKAQCLREITKEIGDYHEGAVKVYHDPDGKETYRRFIPQPEKYKRMKGTFLERMHYSQGGRSLELVYDDYVGKVEKIDVSLECFWRKNNSACDFLAEKFGQSYTSSNWRRLSK